MDVFDSNKDDRFCFQTHKGGRRLSLSDKFVIQANTDSTVEVK